VRLGETRHFLKRVSSETESTPLVRLQLFVNVECSEVGVVNPLASVPDLRRAPPSVTANWPVARNECGERHSTATVDLAGRLAHYLGEINAMHPFREGNGRTQRIFIDQLAKENGYTILWSRCSQQEMIAASVAAHHRDSNMLTHLIRLNLVPRIELLQSKVNSQELTPAAAVAEVERTRYLSASDRIKLRNAFGNNTATEFQRRLQYHIAYSSEQSHRYRP